MQKGALIGHGRTADVYAGAKLLEKICHRSLRLPHLPVLPGPLGHTTTLPELASLSASVGLPGSIRQQMGIGKSLCNLRQSSVVSR